MKIESEIAMVICRRSTEAVRINESRCCYLEHRNEVSGLKTAPGFPNRYLTSHSHLLSTPGTTSVQRVKVRGPLNDVTNVRPSKAQCTTKVDKNEVICYNDLQKAIPFRATSSTPNVQTLSNFSTVMATTNHQVRQSLTSSMAVDFSRNLEAEFATVQRSGETNTSFLNNAATTSVQRTKVTGPLNDVSNARPSKAQCTTKVNKKSVLCYNELQKQTPFAATSSTPNGQSLSNLSTAEVETNFAIQRSQRLTFQKGTTVVDSQQLLIDNIDTVKVDIMPPPAVQQTTHHRLRLLSHTRPRAAVASRTPDLSPRRRTSDLSPCRGTQISAHEATASAPNITPPPSQWSHV
nr:hypothetical protein Iba_chr03bCG3430 [Ipomoea batatas]